MIWIDFISSVLHGQMEIQFEPSLPGKGKKTRKHAFGYFYLVCVSSAMQLQGTYFISSMNRCILTRVHMQREKTAIF